MNYYLGEIRMFAGNHAPDGWAVCDGRLLSIAKNEELYALLGTTYGGDGITDFKAPDMRGRVPVHAGDGTGQQNVIPGSSGGAENVTLTAENLPPHNHTVNGLTITGKALGPAGLYPAAPAPAGRNAYISPVANPSPILVQMNPASVLPNGASSPVSIIQPYAAVTFIISLTGIYPSHD